MNRSKGFTLLELIIVMAIVGILAGLAVPRLMLVTQSKHKTQCAINRIEVQNAERQYVVEHGRPSESGEKLIEAGYLQSYPRCPTGGVYIWLNDATEGNPFRNLGCSIHYFPVSGTSTPTVLFNSDFNDMNGLTPLRGAWDAKDGSLRTLTAGGENRLAFGDKNWKDYTIKVNATLKSGPGYGIYYRADGNPNITGYCFQFDPGLGNKFVVRKVVNGSEQSPFQSVTMPSNFPIYNQNHEITISVQGDRHIISIDNQPIMDFRDSKFMSGMGGLRTWGTTQVAFDNLAVTR